MDEKVEKVKIEFEVRRGAIRGASIKVSKDEKILRNLRGILLYCELDREYSFLTNHSKRNEETGEVEKFAKYNNIEIMDGTFREVADNVFKLATAKDEDYGKLSLRKFKIKEKGNTV